MSAWFEDAPEPIRTLAGRASTHLRERTRVEPDGSPESLALVDHLVHAVLAEELVAIADPRAALLRRGELALLLGPSLGAYFGEVVRRDMGGVWRLVEAPGGTRFFLDLTAAPLRISPASCVAELLFAEPHDHFGTAVATFPRFAAAFAERLACAPPLPEDELWSLCTRFELVQIAVECLSQCFAAEQRSPATLTSTMYDTELGAPV